MWPIAPGEPPLDLFDRQPKKEKVFSPYSVTDLDIGAIERALRQYLRAGRITQLRSVSIRSRFSAPLRAAEQRIANRRQKAFVVIVSQLRKRPGCAVNCLPRAALCTGSEAPE